MCLEPGLEEQTTQSDFKTIPLTWETFEKRSVLYIFISGDRFAQYIMGRARIGYE